MTTPPESPTPSPTSLSRARAITRLVVVVVAVAVYLGVVFVVSALNSPTSRLTGFDTLALPDEDTELRAIMENDGPTLFAPNFAGLQIDFFLRGKLDRLPALATTTSTEGTRIGSASEDSDGFVLIRYKAPTEPGTYRIDLRLATPAELELASADNYLLLTVIPADRPIVVTDIDNTICQSGLLRTENDRPQDAPPFDDAPGVLNEAAGECQVCYLTARPLHQATRTREWLSEYGFPPGPVFFLDAWSVPGPADLPESYFKALFLVRQVRPKWSNIAWGIGNLASDGEAYSANDIRPILIQPEHLIGPGAEIRTVDGWQEIGTILEVEGFAAPTEDPETGSDENTPEATPPTESR